MNTGIFGEGFPYSNFHDLNMDWIIKIAKDFLDQYSHIQEIITNGEVEINELVDSILDNLEAKATQLEELLQDWYDTHSNDIATALTQALAGLETAYNETISAFNTQATTIGQQVIASIPEDYSALVAKVNAIAVANNMQEYWKLRTNSTSSINLFDKNSSSITSGKYMDDNGVEQTNADYNITPYIRIEPTKDYLLSTQHSSAYCAFYDISFTLIADSLHQIENDREIFTAPANAYYFRASYPNSAVDFTMIAETDNLYTSYVPYVPLDNQKQIIKNKNDIYNLTTDLENGKFYKNSIIGNILPISTKYENVYPVNNNGQLGFAGGTYTSYVFPVNEFTPVYVSYVRFYGFMTSDGTTLISGISDITANIPYVLLVPENAEYAVIGFDTNSAPENYTINIGRQDTPSTAYIPTWANPDIYTPSDKAYNASMNSGDSLICNYKVEPRKNMVINFSANITSFTDLYVGLAKGTPVSASVNRINGIKISKTAGGCSIDFVFADGGSDTITSTLQIENTIQISMTTNSKATMRIEITSNGETEVIENDYIYRYGQISAGFAYAYCDNTVLTDCVLGFIVGDIDKKIWYFGDSYTAFDNNRWTGYANSWIDNILLDGFGGETSDYGTTAFGYYIAKGKPKYAVYSLGMNDGGDTDNTTPYSVWKTNVEKFLKLCEETNVTPILCTIPSTPTKNNEGKNYYIRNSGYRYIDFAIAVDPNGNGNWYSGMLNQDNTHPTNSGARTLYGRMISDFPEFFLNN